MGQHAAHAAPKGLESLTVHEVLGDVVWRAARPSGELVYVSPTVEAMTGHPVGQFRRVHDLLARVDHRDDSDFLTTLLSGNPEPGKVDERYRFGHADGTYRWLRCRAVVRPEGLEADGIITDVTAEFEALEHSRQAMAQYRIIADDIPVPVVRLNQHAVVTYINQSAAERWGRTVAEIVGSSLLDLVHPTVRDATLAAHAEAMRVRSPIMRDVGVALDNGQERWTRWSITAVVNDRGDVVGTQGCALDLTNEKQLEKDLTAVLERFELAVSASGDGIFDVDRSSGRIRYSGQWPRILGYDDADLPESLDSWFDLIHPEDRSGVQESLAAFVAEPEKAIREEVRFQHKNGHPVHAVLRIVGRLGHDGRTQRLVGTIADMTGQVAATQRLSSAIENLGCGFAWFDENERLVLHNKLYVESAPHLCQHDKLSGLSFIDLVRESYASVITDADFDTYVKQRLEGLRQGGTQEMQLKTGEWRCLSARRTQENGTVLLVTDVTSLKWAEQRLADAIDAMHEGFMLLDPDLRIVIANRRCQEMYPISGHLLQPGRSYEEFARYGVYHGQYPDAVGREDAYLAEARQLWGQDYARVERRLDGGRWVLMSQRRCADGSIVALRTDLTTQKNREAELERARDQLIEQTNHLSQLTQALDIARAEAIAASKTKTHFLAHTSHELRTPLNAILGFSQIIRDETFGPVGTDAYLSYAGYIHDAGAHLLDLINDILDVARVESGNGAPDVEDIDPWQLTESCLRMLQELARERHISLTASVGETCSVVHADRRSIKQIIINLLSNAIKFTPAGGAVSLSIDNDHNGGTQFSVRDTGIGMTTEEIAKALELFGQVDSMLARESQGTGLGLPLVKSLAEAHGGHLDIQSTPGCGTVAVVHLPRLASN